MAHFYLNVRDGDELIRDPEAYQFANAQAARDATVKTVREVIAEHPQERDLDHKQIEIADATGHAIAVVDIHDVAPLLSN